MGDRLVRYFTVFGVSSFQNWMLIALAIVLTGIVVAWWSQR